MADIQREHKDRLFRFIFGNPDNKEWTLSLYNAVNGSSYDNPDDIQLTTIGDALYMGMKNDVSFLIANTINIYEQQSTYNPNIPVRNIIYLGMLLSSYAEDRRNRINLYSSTVQKFPAPKFICFYNGLQEEPERKYLSLADSFIGEADISARVLMLNINYGKNRQLLASCKALDEYSWLIHKIREYKKEGYPIENAVDLAVSKMSRDSLLKPFILKNKAEVRRMCITEYDEEWTMELFREEEFSKGMKTGEEKGYLEASLPAIINVMHKLSYTPKQAMDLLNIPEGKRPALLAALAE